MIIAARNWQSPDTIELVTTLSELRCRCSTTVTNHLLFMDIANYIIYIYIYIVWKKGVGWKQARRVMNEEIKVRAQDIYRNEENEKKVRCLGFMAYQLL